MFMKNEYPQTKIVIEYTKKKTKTKTNYLFLRENVKRSDFAHYAYERADVRMHLYCLPVKNYEKINSAYFLNVQMDGCKHTST